MLAVHSYGEHIACVLRRNTDSGRTDLPDASNPSQNIKIWIDHADASSVNMENFRKLFPVYHRLDLACSEGYTLLTSKGYICHELYLSVLPGDNLKDILDENPELCTLKVYRDVYRQLATIAGTLMSFRSSLGGAPLYNTAERKIKIEEDGKTGVGPFEKEGEFWKERSRWRRDKEKGATDVEMSKNPTESLTLLCYSLQRYLDNTPDTSQIFYLKNEDIGFHNVLVQRVGEKLKITGVIDLDGFTMVPLPACLENPQMSEADVGHQVRLCRPRRKDTRIPRDTRNYEIYLDALHDHFDSSSSIFAQINDLLMSKRQLFYLAIMEPDLPDDDGPWLEKLKKHFAEDLLMARGHSSDLELDTESDTDSDSNTGMHADSEGRSDAGTDSGSAIELDSSSSTVYSSSPDQSLVDRRDKAVGSAGHESEPFMCLGNATVLDSFRDSFCDRLEFNNLIGPNRYSENNLYGCHHQTSWQQASSLDCARLCGGVLPRDLRRANGALFKIQDEINRQRAEHGAVYSQWDENPLRAMTMSMIDLMKRRLHKCGWEFFSNSIPRLVMFSSIFDRSMMSALVIFPAGGIKSIAYTINSDAARQKAEF